jgi:Ser/Thr protein kinase RdoA (MazF antagonist)
MTSESSSAAPLVPDEVLSAFGRAGATARAYGSGLINKTFLVEAEGKDPIVVQRLHEIFGPKVNDDLDAVTAHLAKKGLVTPRLVRTDGGEACVVFGTVDDGDRVVWRALTRVDGESVNALSSPAQARAAAGLVARFHAAVEDLGYAYLHVRDGVHDTQKHLLALARAMAKHRKHKLGHSAGALGKEILDAGARLPKLSSLPLRHCHGDLKISNIMFGSPIDASSPQASCLVDLDTLQKLQWPLEMGDALRSWCNPKGEDVDKAAIDVDLFTAAVEGYFGADKKPFLMPEETMALVDGLFTICVELAARFCADALNERYFGWDEKRFKTRGEHNLLRARGQWALAKSVRDRHAELNAIVAKNAR